jgi:hypothetical protein
MAYFPRVRPLLREPLLHFLLLGLGLFLLHGWIGGSPSGDGERIVITSGRVEQLVAGYVRANRRAPLRTEIDGMIEDAVREEILYREAMAMGLDKDDTIVRRRLRQKLEFISEDVAPVAEPTDAQLQAYMDSRAATYRAEPRYSLSLVYLDPQKRGSRLGTDAAGMLTALREHGAQATDVAGDSFLLPHAYDSMGASEMSRLFGAQFEATLRTLPLNAWQGPISSGYGAHLVFLRSREGGGAPDLRDVRDGVRNDWIAEQRRLANDRIYADLRKRYQVTVEREGQAASSLEPVVADIPAQ